jgi:iron complex outermembrane recepter protein
VRKALSTILLICLFVNAHSQNKIRGKVLDDKSKPISFCALALLNSSDSATVKGSITNEDGEFTIENLKPGNYFFKISNVGFNDTASTSIKIDSTSDITLEPIVLKSNSVNLNEVAITAIKKPIEFKNGNITVNIEGSPLASGNSVYDLLMKLPGVTVDNGVITIQGKQGVRVLIDDRTQQFSGAQLMGILKSISAANVQKIEILKNPPVKYDAAGNAGIINIVTKKLKLTGFSGSANLSYQQGFYSTQIVGINLNYKGKNFAFFSGFSFNNDIHQTVNHFDRTLSDSTHSISFHQQSKERDGGIYANIFVGADWYINSKNTIGFRVEDMPGNTDRLRVGSTDISDNSLGYQKLSFSGDVPNVWNVVYTNINAEHLFDTIGTKIKFNADYYGPFVDAYGGIYKNNFNTVDNVRALPPQNFNNTNTLTFSTLLTRLDFEKKFKKELSLEAGAKGSFQDMGSDYKMSVYDNNTGVFVNDSNFTNKFHYKEQILAGYLNLQKQIKRVSLQFGLRGENTNIHTLSITSGIAYTRLYFNVFPTISIGYNKSDKHNFQLSYNKRIDRPDYGVFNPYRYFYGNLLSQGIGNPNLFAAYSNNVEFSYNYKGGFGQSLSYLRMNNFIFYYPIQNTSDKTTISTWGNLRVFEQVAYSVFFQKDIKKWWNTSINATAFYFAFDGYINGIRYNNGAPSAYVYASSTFILPKNFKIEIGGIYYSQWLNASNAIKPKGMINFAIKKTFFKDKMDLSIGMNDAFFSMVNKSNSIYNTSQVYHTVVTYDTRRFVTSLNYNFGKVKVQQRDVKDNETQKRLGH